MQLARNTPPLLCDKLFSFMCRLCLYGSHATRKYHTLLIESRNIYIYVVYLSCVYVCVCRDLSSQRFLKDEEFRGTLIRYKIRSLYMVVQISVNSVPSI